MLILGEIRKARGSTKDNKRLGRGQGSGNGKTAGKGHKGQKARKSGNVRAGFEGGQMPLYRRLPKRGFTNIFAENFAIINLDTISNSKLSDITLESLKKSGILKTKYTKLKILGTGEVKKSLKVAAHAASKSAIEKIQKAGGTFEVLKK